MSLNETPSSERIHIGIFGRRNAGKSSLINALTGQETALVSDIAGTTTDPVSKAMELLPLGPVMFIDTPGLDDDGVLGRERVRRGMQVMDKIDIALLVTDIENGIGEVEGELAEKLRARGIPYLTIRNKMDLAEDIPDQATDSSGEADIHVSALTGENIYELRERIAALAPLIPQTPPLISDMLAPGDLVILVTPIDSSAPKGRLILPQQQVIREILDTGAQSLVIQEFSLSGALDGLAVPPKLVVTDSQVFRQVAADTPSEIPLTSFSILFARRKGVLTNAVAAIKALNELCDGDKVLISEGCTHHRQCDDIGTVKIPNGVRKYTGKDISFDFSSGNGFPEDLSQYKLIIHCGACMLNDRSMRHRLQTAIEQGIPFTNYGVLLAHLNGILQRSIAPFSS